MPNHNAKDPALEQIESWLDAFHTARVKMAELVLRQSQALKLAEEREKTMHRPQQLKVSASTAAGTRRPLHDFQPGDVVEGGETGRLYLVIHGAGNGQIGYRVVLLDGPNRWRLGPTEGTFRAAEHAQLDIRRASR